LADGVGQAETGFIFLDDIFYKRLGEEYFVETPTMSEEEYDEFKKNWDTAYKKQIKELIELSTIFKNLCKE